MTPRQWSRIKKIFTEVLRLDSSQRDAYLKRACRSESIRREVKSLLAHHGKAETFMGVHSSVGDKILSHYQVLEQLAAGGMALVYKARDTRLDRFVTIKVLPAWVIGDPRWQERLRQEARRTSALNHPNIVTIYEIVEENGINFIVMEYIAGETLERRLASQKLSIAKALRFAVQIAAALTAAHAAGILHGDLKPSNVMLTEDERVKLLDFGLAKALAGGAYDPVLAGYGTKAYMAPERLRNRGLAPDPRSEVFSFGLVLHEMLSGQHAFGDGDPGAVDAVADAIQTQPPRRLPAKVPVDLANIVYRCLEKSPRRRFASMQKLAPELRRCSGIKGGFDASVAEPTPRKSDRPSGRSSAERQLRAALERIGYQNIALSHRALAEAARLLESNHSPAMRKTATDALVSLILTRDDTGGGVPAAPIRKLRAAALDVLKTAAQGHLENCFEEQDLEDLDLYGINFSSQSFPGFSFRGCFLVEANFQGCDLTGASLGGAFVRNANFAEADLSGADFMDTDWFNALGLCESQLRAVRPYTLRPCPPDESAMHRYLDSHYGIPFSAWPTRIQEQLQAVWQEYWRSGGLRDVVAQIQSPSR